MESTASTTQDTSLANPARSRCSDEQDPRTAHIWAEIRREAENGLAAEPLLGRFLRGMILDHTCFSDALAHVVTEKLANPNLPGTTLVNLVSSVHADNPEIIQAALLDIQAVRDRDPASESFSETLLYFKGFHALQSYRVAHALWSEGRKQLALFIQSRVSEVFGVDVHPAARIGTGIMIDHATSVVVGETAVVDDNVSILHEVTLGGTGKETGDRHPKVGRGVLIGAGAKLLGNVTIGAGAKIGAGSVVLNDVAPQCTVAGIPAVVVGDAGCTEPALEMDHSLPSTASH